MSHAATVLDHIERGRARLRDAGVGAEAARIDAEVLARNLLGWDRGRLIAGGREPAGDGFAEEYGRRIERRARREPVAYIIGEREFWGLPFELTRDVLIPRPETEGLVEEALAQIRAASNPSPLVVDVGTGSGCIATALASELPAVRIVATDVSPAALAVARRNLVRHGVAGRVALAAMDLLSAIARRPDVIVSNPPYVPHLSRETLQFDVRDYEPQTALFGGVEGPEIIRRLLDEADAALAPGGTLVFEFGDGQEDAVRALVAATRTLTLIHVKDDLQGIARVATVRRQAART
jgi:release factor glutamine methyltransferase